LRSRWGRRRTASRYQRNLGAAGLAKWIQACNRTLKGRTKLGETRAAVVIIMVMLARVRCLGAGEGGEQNGWGKAYLSMTTAGVWLAMAVEIFLTTCGAQEDCERGRRIGKISHFENERLTSGRSIVRLRKLPSAVRCDDVWQ
jgi:hypothetical protein